MPLHATLPPTVIDVPVSTHTRYLRLLLVYPALLSWGISSEENAVTGTAVDVTRTARMSRSQFASVSHRTWRSPPVCRALASKMASTSAARRAMRSRSEARRFVPE